MRRKAFISLLVCLSSLTVNAQTYNNSQKEYVLTSLTEGRIESSRTLRTVLCDYQPSGLYVKRGERISYHGSLAPPATTLRNLQVEARLCCD